MKGMFQANSTSHHNGQKLRKPSSMAKTMEEFSFPEVSVELDSPHQLSFPHFASSPLWFQSSTSYQKFATLDRHDQQSKSFSSVEEDLQLLDKKSLTEVKDEERMDMLWEDFNEELHQIPCRVRSGGKVDWSGNSTKLDGKRYGKGDFLCSKAVPHRRSGLMIILKVLKTLLLIQKFRKTRKMSAYHM